MKIKLIILPLSPINQVTGKKNFEFQNISNHFLLSYYIHCPRFQAITIMRYGQVSENILIVPDNWHMYSILPSSIFS